MELFEHILLLKLARAHAVKLFLYSNYYFRAKIAKRTKSEVTYHTWVSQGQSFSRWLVDHFALITQNKEFIVAIVNAQFRSTVNRLKATLLLMDNVH